MTHTVMSRIRTSPKLILFAAVVSLMAVGAGCKSKKKAMEVTDTSAADKAGLSRKRHLKNNGKRRRDEQLKKEPNAKKRIVNALLTQS